MTMTTVVESCIFDAPIAEVWKVIRDFNGHDRWHPAVDVSNIEVNRNSDQVACVRSFRLTDGSELREQLLSLSDRDFEFRYCLLDTPVPLFNYVASMRLRPVTVDSATFCVWKGEFDTPAERRNDLISLVRDGIYRAGLDAIRNVLESQQRND